MEIDSVETRMGKKTIELHHISKSFKDKVCIRDFDYIVLKNQRLGIIGPNGCGKSTLLKIIAGLVKPDSGYVEIGETIRDFDYIVLKNQRLGIIGPNGCGKSTLLKIIAGLVKPDSGYVEIGETIQMGYFSQEIEEMNKNQRVIDYIKDVAEYIPTRDGLISAAKLLEQFLFDSSMQYAPIEKLSGGEKKRLYLLKVLAGAPNVLLLDEITNDIDIPTLTILEDYLDSFAGIVIAVSHDRYFLDNIADRIFEFDGNGNLIQYEGGYTDYLESKKKRFGEAQTESEKRAVGTSADGENSAEEKASMKTWKQNRPAKLKFSYKEQKEYETIDQDIADLEATADGENSAEEKASMKTWKQNRPAKLKFSYKEQKEYETIDQDIADLEAKIEKLDRDILTNATNSGKLNELTKEKEEAETLLEEKMDRWVYLNDLAEKIEAQKNG